MYNYIIMRVSCRAVCLYCFIAGCCLGGAGGLILGLMERQTISVLGGMFLGLLVGVAFALAGLVFAAAFNLVAPLAGGLAIRLVRTEAAAATNAANSPGAAVNERQLTLFPGE
ncbi:MAG: hypothetical protein N2491_03370 [Negativicutes bacterium]|nr:hypothetical protein [Negativicutes bacterium]